jgi:hypothetical protein
MSETNNYTFSSSGLPRLVEFETLVSKDDNCTAIIYKIIGTTYRLQFVRTTLVLDNNKDFVSLWLIDKDGNKVNSNLIKVPLIVNTRSSKQILEANGFTLIYSKSRVPYILTQ